MKFDLYAEITSQIVAMLETGVAPWRSPILGRTSAGQPKNLESGKAYRGINTFILAFTAYARGYESSYWMTFLQAKAKGATIRKGEKASMVVFFKQYEVEDRDTGDPKQIPLLRYFNVFNLAQIEGIKAPDQVDFTPTVHTPIEAAEALVKGYADGPTIEHGGSSAYYRPSEDAVKIPEPTRFTSPSEYYATLLHELSHSTGHSKRLDRKLDTNPKPFGSADYGFEELVAETSACLMCAHCGISPAVIGNQAAYLQGWIKQLKQDNKLVIRAASQGQKAADWVMNIRQQAP